MDFPLFFQRSGGHGHVAQKRRRLELYKTFRRDAERIQPKGQMWQRKGMAAVHQERRPVKATPRYKPEAAECTEERVAVAPVNHAAVDVIVVSSRRGTLQNIHVYTRVRKQQVALRPEISACPRCEPTLKVIKTQDPVPWSGR